MSDVAIVLLTWQRIRALKDTLTKLSEQTYTDFDVYISNGNARASQNVELAAKSFNGKLNIWIRHDGNDYYAFRRMFVGRYLAEQGYKTILFIDDDIKFNKDYVKNVMSHWEPKTYKSGYAWDITGKDYYTQRSRVKNNKQRVKYCGTGISMVDASIFLEDGLLNEYPEGALKVEDLWMSYYVDHVLKRKKWKLKYMNIPNVTIGGADNVALHKQIKKEAYTKSDLLAELVEMGWKL